MKSGTKRSSQNSVKRLSALVEAGQLLNSTLDLEKILSILLGIATKNLGAERGTIYLVDKEKKELWSQVLKGNKKMEIRLPIGKGIAGAVGKSGKTINLKDAYKDKRFHKEVDIKSGFHTRTMLCTPMKDKSGRIIGVFQILNKRKGFFNSVDEKFLTSLSIPASLAIENARLHIAEIANQRMAKELEVAAHIQQILLPQQLPQMDGIRLSATTIPCHAIGGDYYDAIKLDEHRIAIIIADVAGKGVPGALLVSTLQASLHSYLEMGLPAVDLVYKLNNTIYRNSTSEKFITFFIAMFDRRTSSIQYVNAGHNFPFIMKSDGTFIELKKGGFCLGILPDIQFETETIPLSLEDLIVMYTDGISEAMNRNQDLYGEARLYALLKSVFNSDLKSIEQALLNDVKRFADGAELPDDLTMLMMKVE